MGRGTNVWELASESKEPVKLAEGSIDLERHLEDWIEAHPDLLERGLVILARQFDTGGSGQLDLLCLDKGGRLVVVELKRGAAYRDALAQVLDYTARIASMSYDEFESRVDDNRRGRYKGSLGDVLDEHLEDRAKAWAPDAAEPRILIAGTGADESLKGIVKFLGRYDVPVNGVFFDVFKTGSGTSLVVRSGVVDDEQAATQGRSRSSITNDELLAYADSRGSRELVNPVIDAWSKATGWPPCPTVGKTWTLKSTWDGRSGSAWVWPFDHLDTSKKAWLEVSVRQVALDLRLTEDQVRAGLKEAGIVLEQGDGTGTTEWVDLSTQEAVQAVVRWITSAYGKRPAATGT